MNAEAPVEVCNIRKHGKVSRTRMGFGFLAMAVALLAAFVVLGVSWQWRLLAAVPAFLAFGAFSEARRSVCFVLAMTNTFEDEQGEDHRLQDEALNRELRRRSWLVLGDATLCGALSAAVAAGSAWLH